MANSYQVLVDDNYRYMDESERYKLGDFETFEEAEAACKEIVDEFLQKGSKRESITAEELYNCYVMFGEDPWISGEPVPYRFSAWTYAKQRCEQICADTSMKQDRSQILALRQEAFNKINKIIV
jgi:hypothetical protein